MMATIFLDAIFLVTLAITGYHDIKTRLIPAWISIFLLIVTLAHLAAVWSLKPLWGLLPATLIYIALYDDGNGIGGADIQTIGCMGIYFGLSFQLILALLVACIGAIIWDMALRLAKKCVQGKKSIPFCAFLFTGSAASILLTMGGML